MSEPVYDDEGDVVVEREPKWFSVAIYNVHLAYGGPEEGGWWYDAGELVESVTPKIVEKDELESVLKAMQLAADAANEAEGRRPKHSVLSNGVYEAHYFAEELPRHFPAVRPIYE